MKIERTKVKRRHANFANPKRLGQEEQDAYIENTIKIVVQDHNGIIQTKDVTTLGIHPEQLNRYIKKHNDLQKVARGIYVKADEFADAFNILQTRFKKGIFSYETALFLHALTDVTPFDYHMTFPQGYNNKKLAESGVIPSYAVLF